MPKIIAARALPGFKLWVKFEDAKEGTVDLSDLAGKGVFAAWKKRGFFEKVSVDPKSHTVTWPRGIDLSPESLYEDITGKPYLKAVRA